MMCMQVIVRSKPQESGIDCMDVHSVMHLGTDVGGGRKCLLVDEVVGSEGTQEDMFDCTRPHSLLYMPLSLFVVVFTIGE